MPDRPGDSFTSGGYRYVLGEDPKSGNVRPYYCGRDVEDSSFDAGDVEADATSPADSTGSASDGAGSFWDWVGGLFS